MKKNLYIYHHLGIGDHIICNGIVNHCSEEYEKIFLFCKPSNLKNVSFLYRNNPKICLIPMNDDQVRFFMKVNTQNEYLVIGHTPEFFRKLDVEKSITFETGFYEMAKIPFSYKWEKFKIERDTEAEMAACKKTGLSLGEKYVFVHDDISRKFTIKNKYLSKDLRIIRPSDYPNIGIFDFFTIIQNAKEIHVINSSFSALIDCFGIESSNMFYHKYARTDMGSNGEQTLRPIWKILNE